MLTATQMKQDCCGCMACSFSCPKSAISMKEDECGFLYPEINHELCVHCNLCTKVCPLQNTYTGADAVPDIYALQNHQKAIVSESSSGGMFSLLAEFLSMRASRCAICAQTRQKKLRLSALQNMCKVIHHIYIRRSVMTWQTALQCCLPALPARLQVLPVFWK